jgi:hypothetical protein
MQDTFEFAPQKLQARAGRLSGVTSVLAAQAGQLKEMGSERRVSQSTSVLLPRAANRETKRGRGQQRERRKNGCAIREQRPCGVGMFRASDENATRMRRGTCQPDLGWRAWGRWAQGPSKNCPAWLALGPSQLAPLRPRHWFETKPFR